jgi:mRNA-degrading endonuclease RelE of RelBE toxin-antitoxin system
VTGLRLRCGDYRVFFDLNKDGNTVEITAVRQRKVAYR